MSKLVALGVIFAMVALSLHGYNVERRNKALIAKCAPSTVLRTHWGGGTLVSVTCTDERRFTR